MRFSNLSPNNSDNDQQFQFTDSIEVPKNSAFSRRRSFTEQSVGLSDHDTSSNYSYIFKAFKEPILEVAPTSSKSNQKNKLSDKKKKLRQANDYNSEDQFELKEMSKR